MIYISIFYFNKRIDNVSVTFCLFDTEAAHVRFVYVMTVLTLTVPIARKNVTRDEARAEHWHKICQLESCGWCLILKVFIRLLDTRGRWLPMIIFLCRFEVLYTTNMGRVWMIWNDILKHVLCELTYLKDTIISRKQCPLSDNNIDQSKNQS